MEISASDKLFELAGVMLADALWRASEASNGRAFDPYAGVIQDGEFLMADFSPPSEENPDDGARALDYLLAHREDYLAWAFVQDSYTINVGNKEDLRGLKPDEVDVSRFERIDTITVTAWEQGMEEPIAIMQRYAPRKSGRFRMLDDPFFVVEGKELAETDASAYLELLRSGFMQHEDAARHWRSWT